MEDFTYEELRSIWTALVHRVTALKNPRGEDSEEYERCEKLAGEIHQRMADMINRG